MAARAGRFATRSGALRSASRARSYTTSRDVTDSDRHQPFLRSNSIHVIDATLREGMQAAGVRFTVGQSVEIATGLAAIGIDMIECGHPAIGEEELARVRTVVEGLPETPVLAHSRADLGDIRAAAAAGCSWVGIFLGVDPRTLNARVSHWTLDVALDRIRESVSFARSCGLSVRMTVEDTSRADLQTAIRAYGVAVAAGAERICFADTVGLLDPEETAKRIGAIRRAIPDAAIEAHLHDDRGLALANALAAVQAGATWISTSMNGIGERAGITDTAALLANLAHADVRDLREPEAMQRLSRKVADYARAPVDARRPVTGRNAFTHVSRLHRRAMERDPLAYQWIDPARVGRRHRLEAASWALCPERLAAPIELLRGPGEGESHSAVDGTSPAPCSAAPKPGTAVRASVCQVGPAEHAHGAQAAAAPQVHPQDSLLTLLGASPDMRGLEAEIFIGEHDFSVESPATVLLPAGVRHAYRIRRGTGSVIWHVLASQE